MKCLKCGNVMIPRKGKNGEFWGCSAYPECKFTVDGPCDEKDIEEVKEIKPIKKSSVESTNNSDKITKEILSAVKDLQRQMRFLTKDVSKLLKGETNDIVDHIVDDDNVLF